MLLLHLFAILRYLQHMGHADGAKVIKVKLAIFTPEEDLVSDLAGDFDLLLADGGLFEGEDRLEAIPANRQVL